MDVNLDEICKCKRDYSIFDLSPLEKTDIVSYIYAWISLDNLANVIKESKTDTKSAIELFHNYVVYYGLSRASSKYDFLEGESLKRIKGHKRNTSKQTADLILGRSSQTYVQASICVPPEKIEIIEESLIVAGFFLNQKLRMLWNDKIRPEAQEYNFKLAFEVIYDLIKFPRLDNLKTGTRLILELIIDKIRSIGRWKKENHPQVDPIKIVKRVITKKFEPTDDHQLDIHFNEEGRIIIVTYEDQDTEFEIGLPTGLQDLYNSEIEEIVRFSVFDSEYTVIVKKKTNDDSRLSSDGGYVYERLSGPVIPVERGIKYPWSLYAFHKKWVFQHKLSQKLLFFDQYGHIHVGTVNCKANPFPNDKITLALMGAYPKNENNKMQTQQKGTYGSFLLGYHVGFVRLESVCVLEKGLTDDELSEFEKIFDLNGSSDKPENYVTKDGKAPCVWIPNEKVYLFDVIYHCITYENDTIQIEIPRFKAINQTDLYPISKSSLIRMYNF